MTVARPELYIEVAGSAQQAPGQERADHLGHEVQKAWTPKVCRIIAFGAVFGGFGPPFYILLGSREGLNAEVQALRHISSRSSFGLALGFMA